MRWKRYLTLLVCLALLACCLVFPASAATTYQVSEIDLGSPSKIYNDDDTITVTYDLALDPIAYISCITSDTGETVGMSSIGGIFFQQDVTASVSSYTGDDVFSYSGTLSWSSADKNFSKFSTFNVGDYASVVAMLRDCNGIVFNGTLYLMDMLTWHASSLSTSTTTYYGFGNPYVAFDSAYNDDDPRVLIEDNGLPFVIYCMNGNSTCFIYYKDSSLSSSDKPSVEFSLVKVSDVVYAYVGTYNRLNALCYPLGCDSNGYYAIDISDIKDGSDFDLTFDVELERSSALWTGSTLAFKLIWLDADGVLVGTPYDSEFGFNDDGIAIFDSTFTVPSNAEYALLRLDLGSVNVDGVSSFSMTVNDMTLTTTLSALEENSVLLNQVNNTLADLGTSIEEVANGVTITNGKLDDINQSISDGNEKLDDINQGISDANDKLDDMNQGISDTNDKLDQSNEKLDDVNENLEENNSLLADVSEGITSLPGKIADAITGLFVPDAEAMAAQQDKWGVLLSDHLGAVYESVEIIDEVAGTFVDPAVQDTITFPSLTLDLAGTEFALGGWQVDVVPDGFEFIIEILKKIIDIICTFAFINAMRSRFERTLGG